MKEPVIIIAEAGVNHNGSMELAEKLIDAATDAGVDYVKFQTFKTEKLVATNAKKAAYQRANLNDGDDNQFAMLKKLELNLDAHKRLIRYCDSKGVKFLSTAFDLDSVDLLANLGIPFFKIPSGEITNLPYLKKIASTKLPVIISTGMGTMQDVEDCLDVFLQAGYSREQITILHCNTEYPTPYEDVNLRAMNTIAQRTGVQVGYSDHTLGIEIPIAAVALGARVIEKHFTLDRAMEGPDHKASLEPKELKALVSAIRNIEKALGSAEKKPSPSETANMAIARKSIHLSKALSKGTVLKEHHLSMLRPGDGISPMRMDEIIGRTLTRDLEEGHKLNLSDLEA